MNKENCKKSLVRNVSQRVPKTQVKSYKSTITSERKLVEKENEVVPKLNLGLPNLCSSNKLLKKIKDVEQVKTKPTIQNVLFNEHQKKAITKQMNFSTDRQLYTNLLPLCDKTSQPSSSVARDPLPQKDKEPHLKDFITHKTLSEYKFTVPIYNKPMKMTKEYEGFKIYKLTQKW